MEVMVRCAVPDRPGALAALAGAIAEARGDIQAVDVVEHGDGQALDDLVVVIEPGSMPDLLARIEAVEGVEIHHAGPSRGHPGDAVTRLAIGLQSLIERAMAPDEGLRAVVGGALRAETAEIVAAADAPRDGTKTLTLDVGAGRSLVLRRAYRFTDTERERALALARACVAADPTSVA